MMGMRMLCLSVCWLVMLSRWSAEGQSATAHRDVLTSLEYPAYDKGDRPRFNGSAVIVEVDLVLNSVGPVHEMAMTWTASFYLRQEWTDPRLVLGPSGGTVKLDGDAISKLWVPDLYFSNSKEGVKHELTVLNHLAYVNTSNGHILFSQRLTMVLNCQMDLIKFPHDSQQCHMNIESYSFTTEDMQLRWSTSRSATNLLPTAFIPDFEITGSTTADCTATYAIGTYPCLRTSVNLKRQFGFYVFQTYLPSILIVILSWASFWIDHEAVPARISVGLLTVLTITTQLSGSRAQLPRVSYIKAIDVWMSTNLVFVFAAYMEYAVVTVLSRKYKKKKILEAREKAANSSEMELSLVQISMPGDSDQGELDNKPHNNKTHDPHDPRSTSTAAASRVKNGSAGGGSQRQPRIELRRTSSPPPSPSPLLDSTDTGRRVDKGSRFCFPLAFAIFNVVYWSYYLEIA